MRNSYKPKGQTGTNDRAIGKVKGKVVLDQYANGRPMISICDHIVALLIRVLHLLVSWVVHCRAHGICMTDNIIVWFIKTITGLHKETTTQKNSVSTLLEPDGWITFLIQ